MTGKKEYDFVVTLKYQDFRIYNLISILLALMAIAASVFAMMQSFFLNIFWVNVLLIVFIIANFFYYFLKDKQHTIRTYKWVLYASAFLWLLYPLHVIMIAIFYIIAALLERQIKFPKEIGFDTDTITINSFPQKQYDWQQINNVMLKENILTIDFSNNKILQKETESEVPSDTEKDFNEFCKQQLLNNNKPQ